MLFYSLCPISGKKAPLSQSLECYLKEASEANYESRYAALSLMSTLLACAKMSADAPVKTDALGRPFFDAADAPFFSLSHSGDLAAVAVGNVKVGIDVQVHDSRLAIEKLAARWFSAEEQQALSLLGTKEDAFFEQWTKKEDPKK